MNELFLAAARHAAQLVVDGLWQGLLVAAAVALGLRVLPRISAAQRFLIWAAAFALAVSIPFVPLAKAPLGGSPAGVHPAAGWAVALSVVWAIAFAVRAGKLLLQALRVRRIWLAARPVEVSAKVRALLAQCPRATEVCTSDAVEAPSVIGFLSPRLLVPAGLWAQLSEEELEQIVMHECEHLRRYDDWLNLLQKVALAAFPLNPALAWVDRRLGLERELACDAGVVAATGAPLDYAACLTRLAEHRLGSGRLVLALSAWARRSELARRVYTLLQPVRRMSQVGARGSMAALVCLVLAAAGGVAHAPRLVSFAPAGAAVAPGARLSTMATEVVFHEPVAGHAREALVAPRRSVRVVPVRRRIRAAGPRMYRVSVSPNFAPAYVVPVRFSYSYAAVPFGDGWLIVQL